MGFFVGLLICVIGIMMARIIFTSRRLPDAVMVVLFILGMVFLVFGTISIAAFFDVLGPSIKETKNEIKVYESLVQAYHDDKLTKSEAEYLAIKIDKTNEHIRFLKENQRSLMYGLWISNDEIEEIEIEDWMEDYIEHYHIRQVLQ